MQGRSGERFVPDRYGRSDEGAAMDQRLVTVFGGTGFVGRAIVRALAESGCRVRVAARHPRAVDFAGSAVEARRADVRSDADVATALGDCTAAVNAIGLYVERRGLGFDAIHAEGAARIARLGREAGLTGLVHVSGIGTDPASPSRYVRARAEGERRVLAEFPGAVILRPSVIFGRGDSFLATLAGVCRLPVIPLFGDGGMRLQPVWVGDVAAAVERCLTLPGPAGGVFELGGRDVLSYREILQAVMARRGLRRWLLPTPFPVWRLLAAVTGRLPSPPLTRDQVMLMQSDNIVGADARTFADLEIEPRGLRDMLAECLPDEPERAEDT